MNPNIMQQLLEQVGKLPAKFMEKAEPLMRANIDNQMKMGQHLMVNEMSYQEKFISEEDYQKNRFKTEQEFYQIQQKHHGELLKLARDMNDQDAVNVLNEVHRIQTEFMDIPNKVH